MPEANPPKASVHREEAGFIVGAMLVLSPEGMAAIHAALANRIQRAVNICLGSALATIGLTVPAVLVIGLITGQKVVLGLDEAEIVPLAADLAAERAHLWRHPHE